MAKDRNEFNDIQKGTAIADLLGRRQGRVQAVFKGNYRVLWSDGEQTNESRDSILVRYTTQSAKF